MIRRLVAFDPLTSELIDPTPSLLTWRPARSMIPDTVIELWAWAELAQANAVHAAIKCRFMRSWLLGGSILVPHIGQLRSF
jgi:hypothetical protein